MIYPLFETLAIVDGRVQNLAAHQRRYAQSLAHFYGSAKSAVDLGELFAAQDIPSQGLFRARMDYNLDEQQLRIFPYQRRDIRSFQPVVCDHIRYQLKFSDRSLLEQLFAQRGDCDEIMIIRQGWVSDCSIGNLIFKRQGEWFTPTTPLLNGTQRQTLLAEGKIRPRPIAFADLDLFEEIRLINALNGLS